MTSSAELKNYDIICRVHNELNIASIGPKLDLAYEYKHLGDNPEIISQVP
jgi:hypothetical protein